MRARRVRVTCRTLLSADDELRQQMFGQTAQFCEAVEMLLGTHQARLMASLQTDDVTSLAPADAIHHDVTRDVVGNVSVPKIIIIDTVFFFLNCNQHFGNFKPY